MDDLWQSISGRYDYDYDMWIHSFLNILYVSSVWPRAKINGFTGMFSAGLHGFFAGLLHHFPPSLQMC